MPWPHGRAVPHLDRSVLGHHQGSGQPAGKLRVSLAAALFLAARWRRGAALEYRHVLDNRNAGSLGAGSDAPAPIARCRVHVGAAAHYAAAGHVRSAAPAAANYAVHLPYHAGIPRLYFPIGTSHILDGLKSDHYWHAGIHFGVGESLAGTASAEPVVANITHASR